MSWLKAFRLKSDNPTVRRRAVEGLAGSADYHDTDLLVAKLDDESALVRCAAVRALETAPEEACIQGLLSALRDDSEQVRAVAATVLGRRGDRSVAWPLSFLLNDSSSSVRESAAHALQKLGWKPSTGQGGGARFEIGLGNTRSATLNPLVGELTQDTAFYRRAMAEALKEVNDPSKIAPWLAALTNPDPAVRIDAIHALDSERDEVVTVELLKRLRDLDRNVRLAA